MILVRTCAAVAAICLASTTAVAQEAAQPQAPAPAKEKKVCRPVTPTGSIMSKRMCLTKAEWAKVNEQYEKQNETFRDRQGRGGPPSTQ